jgi:hypothetical protein
MRNTVDILRGLTEFEGRPKTIGPVEMLLVLWLVEQGALERPVRGSSITLSMALGCSESTVQRAVDNLVADGGTGWIAKKSGKGRGNGNTFTVLLDKLPVAEELRRTIIGKTAMEIARRYCATAAYSPVTFKKRRFTRANHQRIAFCVQTFLDKHCAGDVQLLRDALNFARLSAKYSAKYYRGLHELRRDFSAIVAECRGVQPPAPAPAPTPARLTAEQSEALAEAARKQVAERAA